MIGLRNVVLSFDSILARMCTTNENGVLLSFLFHGLFESEGEAYTGVVDPQQAVTVEMLRTFILHFQKESYQFVTPDHVVEGLSTSGKYIVISFDDGYYNNGRALPILEEFGVPAVFFISSNHVKYGKAFWWDVVYRQMRKRNQTEKQIGNAVASYKKLKTSSVELLLREQYGEKAMRPVSDLDRPFSAHELREFSKHPLVFLGNHTEDHAILTNYSVREIRKQIQGCQQAVHEMTGKAPRMIAFPNGNVSAEVHSAAREAGLCLGVGVRPGRNQLPLRCGSTEMLSLRRFTLWGDRSVEAQCKISRSSVSFYRVLDSIRQNAVVSTN